VITPPALDPDRFAKELEEALAGGDVACLLNIRSGMPPGPSSRSRQGAAHRHR
jgi:hypothetical protein